MNEYTAKARRLRVKDRYRAGIDKVTTGFTIACIAATLLITTAGNALPEIIHVPADSPTIQAGIDGTISGDTVLVAEGVYTGEGNRDIDFLGKDIVVMSEEGPEYTIIDCEGWNGDPHSGFTFHSGENSSSVIWGFTIKNGFTFISGAGILCSNSSPTISDNIIEENLSGARGGGIYCSYSSPTIVNNIIRGNGSGDGGGIGCYFSFPAIVGNTIRENSAGRGGGIYCSYSSPVIDANTIEGNTANLNGGGIRCTDSSSPIISNNFITGNAADNGGGINCFASSSLTLMNNTVSGNTAGRFGGGIRCNGSTLVVDNCIIWGNSPDELNGGDPSVTYCNVQYGWPGEGNIDEDPLFVDPDSSNFDLQSGSPCIDAGNPTAPNVPWGGFRRDMGAFEYDQGFYFDGQNVLLKPFPMELQISR